MSPTESPRGAPDTASELIRLETRVIEAERRFVPAVLHYLDARKQHSPRDPRRSAARSALLWCFFPFNNGASTAGFLGLLLTIFTVYLLRQDLAEVRAQNELSRQQFEFTRQQFDAQRRLDARRRRSELLTTLLARKDCLDSQLRRCPFVADVQTRMLTLTELSDIEAALAADGEPARTGLMGVELRNTVIPRGTHLRDINLGDIDLSHASLFDVTLERVQMISADMRSRPRLRSTLFDWGVLNKVILRYADLRDARFENAKLRAVDMGSARLEGASFAHAQLDNVMFSNAFLQGADFSQARLTDCKFVGARLDGAVFPALDPELAADLGAAATCPDGQTAEGSCAGQMTPAPWTTEERRLLRDYLDRVEADLMFVHEPVASAGSFALLELTLPTGADPLDISEPLVMLEPSRLAAIRGVLHRHAGMLDLPAAVVFDERLKIQLDNALVTVTSTDTANDFRRDGCLPTRTRGSSEEGVTCDAGGGECWVGWHVLPAPILTVWPCRWDRAHAEERVEYTVREGRQSVILHALGEASLLHLLGFRPGDIVSVADMATRPAIRHARLWADAGDIPASESTTHVLTILRGRAKLQKTIHVRGRKPTATTQDP